MLSVDSSLFIQIVNFVVLLLVMNIIVYRPIRKILTERSHEMDSLENSIKGFGELSEKGARGLEEGRVKAIKEGYREKEKLKNLGRDQEQQIVGKASASADEKVGKALEGVDAKMSEVRESLAGQVDSLSSELAEKILGRKI